MKGIGHRARVGSHGTIPDGANLERCGLKSLGDDGECRPPPFTPGLMWRSLYLVPLGLIIYWEFSAEPGLRIGHLAKALHDKKHRYWNQCAATLLVTVSSWSSVCHWLLILSPFPSSPIMRSLLVNSTSLCPLFPDPLVPIVPGNTYKYWLIFPPQLSLPRGITQEL